MSEIPKPLHADHSRLYRDNKYVYPVLSRRSRGVSLGINLNPDKICNFDCIYCQVNRRVAAETRFVEMDRLLDEVDRSLDWIVSGKIYRLGKFASTPAELRRLNDLAFSGDGEPTTFRNFDEIVGRVSELKRRHGLDETRLVLITNASKFHRAHVQRGLRILDDNQGQIWAKLDAGTDEYYHLIERTTIPFRQILDNIADAARTRPIVIQSIFMNVAGAPPSANEIDEYCARLREIVASGGRIELVQVYTVARPPAESYVTSLSDAQVDAIAERVRQEAGLSAEAYYGAVQ